MFTKLRDTIGSRADWVAKLNSEHQNSVRSMLISAIEVWLRGDSNVESCPWFEMPESFTGEVVVNTGLMGGNNDCGGVLAIKLKSDGGANFIDFTPSISRYLGGDESGPGAEVTLIAKGDWEQKGLRDTLAYILLKILHAECE